MLVGAILQWNPKQFMGLGIEFSWYITDLEIRGGDSQKITFPSRLLNEVRVEANRSLVQACL